jgi:pimeloyl-ACP methyl ester carboxylesterase
VVTVKRFLSTVSIFFLLILASLGNGQAQSPASLGIVLLYGENGSPTGPILPLTNALRDHGYTVSTPAMPWASGEIYNAGYDKSLELIGAEVKALRAKGVQNIVVAGHSLGGHMALAYAGTDSSLAGVILLAPGHYPETYANKKREVMDSIKTAKDLIEKGALDKKIYFNEMHNGEEITVLAKPEDYLSFCDPEGPCQLSNALSSFRQSLPVLLISEWSPRLDPKKAIFDVLPQNEKSLFVKSKAGHKEVPNASINDVLSWLKTLAVVQPK